MPWMILPGKLEEITGIVERKLMDQSLTAEQIKASIEASQYRSDDSRRVSEDQVPRGVEVIQVTDTLVNRANILDAISGATSYQNLVGQINAASDAGADIVLDMDSPGGSVNGVFAVVDAIQAAKEKGSRVYAVMNDMGASAAYLIASHANQIVVTQGSTVGSIGVMMVHMDRDWETPR